MRRRHPRDWELRDPRFEELDSDEDEMGNGVVLDPHYGYARGFRGDELYFDGYDIGQARNGRRAVYDYGDDFDSDGLDYRDQRGRAYQDAIREKEDALAQSALERIARANAKGKTNVNLTREEMEALERRRSQQPESPVPLASPPATPAKTSTPKGKPGSRSNSSSNLSGQKGRSKRGSSGIFGGRSSSPAKSNSKAKVSRKPSDEQATPYPSGPQPPGIMVPGPNGTPVYAPIGYYAPPSPEYTRSPAGSKAGSRSGSKHSRRESTPPDRTADPYAYPPRYYPPPAGMRPESSHSNRSLPDDIDWYPPTPRNRSASSATYAAYPPPAEYDPPPLPLPAAQGGGGGNGRRNVSGPPDVRYASLRRVPPSSPLAPRRPEPHHAAYSDPVAAQGRRGSLLAMGRDGDASSSSSSDDQGVQVDIVPDAAGGYSISRAPAAVAEQGRQASGGAAPSGNEGRRRKGRR